MASSRRKFARKRVEEESVEDVPIVIESREIVFYIEEANRRWQIIALKSSAKIVRLSLAKKIHPPYFPKNIIISSHTQHTNVIINDNFNK